MPDILHRVGIKSSSAEVYKALTSLAGLSAWWTEDTTGESRLDGVIAFRFGPAGGFNMQVIDLVPGSRVSWLVVDGPADWIGTKIYFDLKQEDDYAIVMFKHEGWKEPVEFMHHCSTKWATFLMSLKALNETGTGAPHPNDVLIDNWK